MKVRIPNSGGPGNMNAMLKQAQKMQADMAALQEELEAKEYTAQSGGGVVTATVYGTHLLKSIEISPEVVEDDDIDFLQDMIVAAVNDAIKAASDDSSEKMGAITGGLNMPGMF